MFDKKQLLFLGSYFLQFFADFVYEAILLPSIRWNLRNELFALRDRLRNVVIENQKHDKTVFDLVHNGLNNYINRLHWVDLRFEFKFRKILKNNPAIRKEVEQNLQKIEESKNQEIKAVFYQTKSILWRAFAANIGGFLCYLIPLVFIVFSIEKLLNIILKTILAPTKLVREFAPVETSSI